MTTIKNFTHIKNIHGRAILPTYPKYQTVSAGEYRVDAIRSDGSIDTFGNYTPPAGNNYIQVFFSQGNNYSIAQKTDGSLVGWGNNVNYGQLTIPSGTDYVEVAPANYTVMALKTDGSVIHWGSTANGATGAPSGNNYTQISSFYVNPPVGNDYDWFLFLKSDGSITNGSTGYNAFGENSVPSGTGYKQVSAGGGYGLAIKSDNSIIGWGNNQSGCVSNIPNGNDFLRVSAGDSFAVALKMDGSVVGWGQNYFNVLSNIPATKDFVQISASIQTLALLRKDGSLIITGNTSISPSGTYLTN